MSVITFVRHGQANSNATTEEDYDRLSDLGRQQAQWLGELWDNNEMAFDAVFSGTLTRQIDTLELLNVKRAPAAQRDERLNEIQYHNLVACMEQQFNMPPPAEGTGFIDHFHKTFEKWEGGEIQSPPETWENYETRVRALLDDLRHAGQNVLAVTSGGIVAMALAQALGVGRMPLVKFLLEGVNTGITQLHYLHGEFHIKQFNSVPHLEMLNRLDLRTYY